MEEDNDDFLGGVIEFGDGRQYKIQPADGDAQAASTSSPPRGESVEPPLPPPHDGPVHKEDRFADDFDRSWPRSSMSGGARNAPPAAWGLKPRGGPGSGGVEGARSGMSGRAGSSTSSLSPQEPSRVLFNERSNKLEPYANVHSRGGPGESPSESSFA